MPEGPENARYADFLTKTLTKDGKWLLFVGAMRYGDKFSNDLELLSPALRFPVLDIFSKGKEVYIVFYNGISIRGHLGMDGCWSTEMQPNSHFMFEFAETLEQSGTELKTTKIYYVNSRFGEFDIFTSYEMLAISLNRIKSGFTGRYILSPEEWVESMSKFSKTKLLRSLLMDQKELCSGIGNYLLAEILYHARLHPNVRVGQLSPDKILQLYSICLFTVNGHYTGTLEKVIYQKRISPGGNPIVNESIGSRTMWYCPVEQPLI